MLSAVSKIRRIRPSFLDVCAFLAVIAVTAAGLIQRMNQLGVQSLWVDEALSVVFAGKPLPELMALTVREDVHPPLYPILLHFWIMLAGNSEYAVRLPSVMAGTILIPLIYMAGRELERLVDSEKNRFFSVVGLAAAILAATSNFYIGYSQTARSYMPVTLAGLLSSYLLLRALRRGGRLDWLWYGLATVAALYTHYTAFLLVAAHFIFVLFTARQYGRGWRYWLLSMAGCAVAYLPWVGFSIGQMERISDYWPGTLRVGAALQTSLLQFVAGGASGNIATMAIPAASGIGLLALGVVALATGGIKGRKAQPTLFLLLYLLVPCVALFAIAYARPKFDPRYLLVATPAFYLILAWGVAALVKPLWSPRVPLLLRGILPLIGIAALVAAVGVSLVYGDPAKIKHIGDGSSNSAEYGDYRALVSYIEANSQPGDAVVLMMNTYHPYVYYSKLGIPWYPMEPFDDFDGAIIRLNRMAAEHGRLWFILWEKDWADPADYVMHVMEDQAQELPLDQSFGGLGLRLFQLTPDKRFDYYPRVDHKTEAIFGKQLEFWGWNVSQTNASGGDTIKVDLHWRALKKISSNLKTVLTIVDKDKHVWARTDETMATALYPTSKWKIEEIVHDRHQVQLPVGAPPGEYEIDLTLYDPVSLSEVPIATWRDAGLGTSISLGKLAVTTNKDVARAPSADSSSARWDLGSDRIELLGSSVDRAEAKPGGKVDVTLTWRPANRPSGAYLVRLALMDARGNLKGETTVPMVNGYPTYQWDAGETVMSKYWLDFPTTLEAGKYSVMVAAVASRDSTVPAMRYTRVATVDVTEIKASYELPPIANPLNVRLGDRVELAGYDLSATTVKPGQTIKLTLYWEALDSMDRGYKVFNHVIDANNVFGGQRDGIPMNESRPTTSWRKGEVFIDTYEIPIYPQAAPGSYSLKVGMYEITGAGERLKVTKSDGSAAGDSVTLSTIEVTP